MSVNIYSQVSSDYIYNIASEITGTIILDNGQPIGTGFACCADSIIITCHHVNKNLGNKLISINNHKYKLTYINSDTLADIAYYKADSLVILHPTTPDYSFSVNCNDRIYYNGYDSTLTGSRGFNSCLFNSGIVSIKGKLNVIFIADFIEFKGKSYLGYSGGPVFNNYGRIIGILAQAYSRKSFMANSIPDTIVRAFSIQPLKKLLGK